MLDRGRLPRFVLVVVAAALAISAAPRRTLRHSLVANKYDVDFKTRDALNGWIITGDVTIDTAKSREQGARSRSARAEKPC